MDGETRKPTIMPAAISNTLGSKPDATNGSWCCPSDFSSR